MLSTGSAARGDAETTVVLDLETPTSLAGEWRFHPGDDSAWADPAFDDSDWEPLPVPGSWVQHGHPDVEIGWYRHTIVLPAGTRGGDTVLGLRLGEVFAAYELFVGGERIGGVGALPPRPELAYDQHRTFQIPRGAIGVDGRLAIALRIWRAPPRASGLGGITRGPVEIGHLADVVRRAERSDLPRVVLAALFAVIGIYHLWLFALRREATTYLWFGLFALTDAIFTFVRMQWRFAVFGDHFVAIKEVEYFARYLLPALAIQFIWPFFGRAIGRWTRAYQLSHVSLAVAVLATPGLTLNLLTVRASELWVLPLLVAVVLLIIKEAWKGHPDARTIGMGLVVLSATYVADIATGRGLFHLPDLSNFGFAALLLSMAASLGNRFRRVHQRLDTLRLSLEEQVEQRTRDLRAATTEAEAASHSKGEFIAHMSHELRTPMTGIVGMTGLLSLTELDADQSDYVATIQASNESLQRLIDDVLDFSRIESGNLELVSYDFDPVTLVDEVAAVFQPTATQAGIELAAEVGEGMPPRLQGDVLRIRQVLSNLVGNAVRFTEHGRVQIVAKPIGVGDDLRLHIEVSDTGIGIPSDKLDKIFEPFTQADNSMTRAYGGVGLGLSIAKRLVALMGGEIGVESTRDAGSLFWFEIPVGAAQASSILMPPTRPIMASSVDKYRVLVAEDDAVNRTVLRRMLEQLGVEVETVEDGREALGKLEEMPFHLVLMDCQMPRLDGLSATRKVREREAEGRHLTIIGVTAFARSVDREQCLAAGMDDHLAKPYRLEDLILVLDRWLPEAVRSGVTSRRAREVGSSSGAYGKDMAADPDGS